MYLTVEELYAFKEQYQNEIAELNRKMEVVDELILFVGTKAVEAGDEEHITEECENVIEAEENTTNTSF